MCNQSVCHASWIFVINCEHWSTVFRQIFYFHFCSFLIILIKCSFYQNKKCLWTREGGPWTRGPCFVLTLIFQLIFPPFHLDFILYSIKCSEYFWSELIFQVLKYKTWLKWQMIPKSEVKRKGYFTCKRQEMK